MKTISILSVITAFLILLAVTPVSASGASDAITTPRIEAFPHEPQRYKLIDWRQRAEDFVSFTLDPTRRGDYLPLMWWDDTKIDGRETTFGLPSYVGMKKQWGVFQNTHEGIVTMSTLLSAALLGHDMSRYVVPGNTAPVNLVRMQEAYFSAEDGVFLNGVGRGKTGGTFWYELMPSLLVGSLVATHPGEVSLTEKWHQSCQAWAGAGEHLWQLNDYNFQAYDLRNKRAVVQKWREPDAAAGLAFLMQMAHAQGPQEDRFYHEMHHALTWLDRQERNISYELFSPYGVYAAARCNAENGSVYHVERFFGWCFEDSAVRGIGPHSKSLDEGDGWGVPVGRWNDYDVAGLVGCSRGALSTSKLRGGYVFAMETFAYAWPLVAATRYDNRLARSVGKWMYHAAHSARLFYPDQLPPEKQSDWAWAGKFTTSIPYEGLMEKNNLTGEPGPFASGDPSNQGWGPINLGIYSGALSGVFGAIVKPTNVEGVLALDTNKTDFFAKPSYPATLVYNPRAEVVHIKLPVGDKPVHVWDAVANVWLAETPVRGECEFPLASDKAVLATFIPADQAPHFDHGRLYGGTVVADYSVNSKEPR
jgi:hypothetical protein